MPDSLMTRLRANPRRSWLLGAALVLIVCQLLGIVALADSQNLRAEQRQAEQQARHAAVLQCLGNGRPTRIDVCQAQARAGSPRP